MAKHYPSQRKNTISTPSAETLASVARQLEGQEYIQIMDTKPLTQFKDNPYNEQHKRWEAEFLDSWQNRPANIGAGNSLMQYGNFKLRRHSYQELAHLATDDIIKSAIDTIAQECTGQWGQIVINELADQDQAAEIINKLENRLQDLNIKALAKQAIQKALIYGGVGLFYNIGGQQDLAKEFSFSERTLRASGLKSIELVEPWAFSPMRVNTYNPISGDFMKPSAWFVMGAGEIDTSRFDTLAFFEAPDLLKPLYNFLGVSLISFMHDKVKSADTIRQSLADLFIRFRTNIIKTPVMGMSDDTQITGRMRAINAMRNNHSTILLTEQEEFVQSITPLTGLDKIQAQAYEAIASSARMPAIKLLGLTPSGFNATGEFDLLNYYDTISGYQNTILRSFLEKVMRILALEMGFDISPEFKFTPLKKETKIEAAQTKIANADFVSKLTAEGILTQEQALGVLQENEALSKAVKFETEADIDLGELGLEPETEKETSQDA